MQWGIAFRIPAIFESDLRGLPPPSHIWRSKSGNNREKINILYHFSYAPQNKKEWQRVAGIKVQIKNKIKSAEFQEYEPLGVSGEAYTVSDLGKDFKDFVKFPAAFFDGTPQMMLTRHAKRLHYQGILHIEQLIFLSFWIAEIAPPNEIGRRPKKEGVRQIMRRAMSAMKFAEDHKDGWQVKLSVDKRHEVLSQAAFKSAQVKRDNSKDKRERAKSLREDGETLSAISYILGVSLRTVSNYLK